MARYIDAEKLIEHLNDLIEECENPNVDTQPIAYGTVLGLKGALSYAETLPTADVVEVVRCKDCRHCEILIDQFDIDWYFCKNAVNNAKVEADDFCSYGERRTE